MKERILKESINLFLHKGYQGTSIKDITGAVHLTKGAIYWYFKSKDELLETILHEWGKSYLSGLIKAVDAVDGDFLAKFRCYGL
jgi:AcrR family transcriptional regulator